MNSEESDKLANVWTEGFWKGVEWSQERDSSPESETTWDNPYRSQP